MAERFIPSRPDALGPLGVQPSLGPTHSAFFPVAVSTPVSGNDWLATENLHRVAVHRNRPLGPVRSHSETDLIKVEDDVETGAGISNETPHTPQRHTFSIEPPPSRPETPQDVPLIKVHWGVKPANSTDPQWLQDGGSGLNTPAHPAHSPAKGYPSQDACYLGHRGASLLANAPRRRACCLRPLTIFLAGLLILAAVLIGLAVGQFAVPFIRAMNSSAAPARPVSTEPLEALPTQAPGADSMDSVSGVGIGLEVDSSGIIDNPKTQPGRAWHNPYLDHARQGEGEASTTNPSGKP